MEPNRELAELVGLCWHELIEQGPGKPPICTCNGKETIYGDGHLKLIPDYAADPRLVLREMMRREDWHVFWHNHIDIPSDRYRMGVVQKLIDLILDTTGQFRDEAIKFLKEVKDEPTI